MRIAVLEIIDAYNNYLGSARIILLFICAVCFVVYFNMAEDSDKRRRINPAVFLLSIWSGIAYSMTLIIRKAYEKQGDEKKVWQILRIVGVLIIGIAAISITGGFVYSEANMKESIYYYTHYVITIASVLAIISFFVIYYLIATELFETVSDKLIFIGSVAVLHLFAVYTVFSIKFSIFLYPLSIGSIVIHDFMPFAMWILLVRLRIVKERENTQQDSVIDTISEQDDNYEEEWDLKKHKILNMRNMAIAFVALLLVVVACVVVLNSKINSLYNVTAAITKATEDKLSLYEFKPKGSEETVATMMVSGEGTVTVTGGGSDEYGQELYDFISERTVKVDNWYLYADDDENRGAMYVCISKGLIVENVYVLTGVETVGDN